MSTSFDLRSCSHSSVAVGGIICVPDVFVKAGVPTGTMLEIAMVLTAVSSRDTSFTVVEMQVLHYHQGIWKTVGSDLGTQV